MNFLNSKGFRSFLLVALATASFASHAGVCNLSVEICPQGSLELELSDASMHLSTEDCLKKAKSFVERCQYERPIVATFTENDRIKSISFVPGYIPAESATANNDVNARKTIQPSPSPAVTKPQPVLPSNSDRKGIPERITNPIPSRRVNAR